MKLETKGAAMVSAGMAVGVAITFASISLNMFTYQAGMFAGMCSVIAVLVVQNRYDRN